MTHIQGRLVPVPAAFGEQALVVLADGSILVTGSGGGSTPVVPAATPIDVSTYATQSIVLAAPGRIISWAARNKSGATVFIMFFDAVADPGDGAIPDRIIVPVLAGLQASNAQPSDFATGIVWVASSTDIILTEILAADVWVDTAFIP